MTRWFWLVLPFACALFGCREAPALPGETTAYAADGEPAKQSTARVIMVKPERKTLRRSCTQPGQVEAFEEAPIHAKIAGYVRRVLVDIGDRVSGPKFDADGRLLEPGQVLAELSVPELEDDLQRTQASLVEAGARVEQSQAQVTVSEASVGAAEAHVQEADAAIARATADAERWRSEHARIVELAAHEAVTAKLVDETTQKWLAAQAAEKEARAKVDAARAAVLEAQAGLSKSNADAAVARAQRQVAQAEVAHAESMLGYATLRAPFDGVVSTRNVHPGHFVQPGTNGTQSPLFVVLQADRVRVFVDVPEADAALVETGDRAEIQVDALPGPHVEANVTRTSWSLNTATRTLRTEIDVDNASGQLRPGMYVRATIVLDQRSKALVLPATAVFMDGEQAYCVVVREKRAARVPIELGFVAGKEVEIVHGLQDDDSVVATGAAGLVDGQTVEVAADKL